MNQPCKCHVNVSGVAINFCSLHAAAEVLRDAVKKAKETLELSPQVGEVYDQQYQNDALITLCDLDDALAHADGRA